MLKLIHTKQLLAILTTFIILGVASNASASPLDVSVTIPPSLNVTLTGTDASGNVSLNLNPATSAFSTRDLTISVGTNNPSGYTLTMTANGTSLIRTEAVSGIYPTIATLASEVAEGSFTTNRWGYRFTDNTTNTNFQPLPGVDPATGITTLPISESDSAVNNKARTITFGAKVDTTQTPGDYELAMTFAATAKPNIMYMQNLTDAQCTTTATDAIDLRDGQAYTIQRLADGQCWMMTNLKLGATDLTTDLTSDNTHLATTVSAATFNGWKKSSGSESYTSAEFIPITASNSSDSSATDSTNDMPYGTLYNYCATSAGTYCYPSGSGTGNATSDLCPKGWRLPTGGSSGEFQTLYSNSSYNTNAKMRNPISAGGAAFTRSGYFYNGSPTLQGSNGYFWSSTRYDGYSMYDLGFNDSSATPDDSKARSYGFPIRCIKQSAAEIAWEAAGKPTMQEVTSITLATILPNAGDVITLTDSRDSKNYTVGRLADGKVWMTSNLNLAGGTVLSSDKSDVPTTNYYTLPTSSTSGFSSSTTAYVYNSGNNTTTCNSSQPCNSYYSWLAATAGGKDKNDTAVNGDGYSAAYSICPKGWKLPSATTEGVARDSGGYTGGDFYKMIMKYMGGAASLNNGYYDNTSQNLFYTNAGPNTTPDFLLAGRYYSSQFGNGGLRGAYWSSTSFSSSYAYSLSFYADYINSAHNTNRFYGYPVRCLFSE